MKNFVDGKNRVWELRATVPAQVRIREQAGIDLADIFSDSKSIERILTNITALVDVLEAWLAPEIAEQDATDFREQLYGDLLDDALAALVAELPLFYTKSRRHLVSQAIERFLAHEAVQTARLSSVLDSDKFNEKFEQIYERTLEEFFAGLEKL